MKPRQGSNIDISKYNSIVDGLKALYRKKIKPVEETYKFEYFHSPILTDSDIEAKPMVLLLGQYSTGKTTFIKYLLEREYAGCHIGPEPTVSILYLPGRHLVHLMDVLRFLASRRPTALSQSWEVHLTRFYPEMRHVWQETCLLRV
jgi:ATPase subunit of ABC transporter with duplicated ATPase domains